MLNACITKRLSTVELANSRSAHFMCFKQGLRAGMTSRSAIFDHASCLRYKRILNGRRLKRRFDRYVWEPGRTAVTVTTKLSGFDRANRERKCAEIRPIINNTINLFF